MVDRCAIGQTARALHGVFGKRAATRQSQGDYADLRRGDGDVGAPGCALSCGGGYDCRSDREDGRLSPHDPRRLRVRIGASETVGCGEGIGSAAARGASGVSIAVDQLLGSTTPNVMPLITTLCSSIRPLCASTISLQMVSPRPVPLLSPFRAV